MKRKLHKILCVFGAAISLTICTTAQNRNSAESAKNLKEKIPQTVSYGVVSGRALELVAPTFPKAACLIRVYGRVTVKILIDIDGRVISAEAISGHPMLLAASVNAARSSTFKPNKIGNTYVRVSGIIQYNYRSETWNWLELGYSLKNLQNSFYSSANETNHFPEGFSDEWDLVKTIFDDREQRVETAIASIRGKLSENEKSAWLFSVGLTLGKIVEDRNDIEGKNVEYINELRVAILSKPKKILPGLIQSLERLIENFDEDNAQTPGKFSDDSFQRTLREIEENLPMFGK